MFALWIHNKLHNNILVDDLPYLNEILKKCYGEYNLEIIIKSVKSLNNNQPTALFINIMLNLMNILIDIDLFYKYLFNILLLQTLNFKINYINIQYIYIEQNDKI